MLFVRQDFAECLQVIDEQIKSTNGLCEYALYIKGLIKRQHGEIAESLQLFQAAAVLNPQNPNFLKQVGRSLYKKNMTSTHTCRYLLGKHKDAIELYEEAAKYNQNDWEILHNKGLCFMHMKMLNEAEECFMAANAIQRHDSSYLQLGKVYTVQGKYKDATEVYLEALE